MPPKKANKKEIQMLKVLMELKKLVLVMSFISEEREI